MDCRREANLSPSLQIFDNFSANRIFPDRNNRSPLGGILSAKHPKTAKLRSRQIVIANTIDPDPLRLQNIKDDFGVPAGSVKKKHLCF